MNNEQRKYKDTIFRSVFSNPADAIDLYNQISDTKINSDAPVEIVTLTDELYVKQLNDLGLLIDNKLIVLVEQQSTYSKNLPLRLLMYIAREYEKVLDKKALYRSKRVEIPNPEFFVLYNGSKPLNAWKQTLRLSDLYVTKQHTPSLELTVTLIDINSSQFKIAKNSTLQQYITAIKELKNCHETDGDMVKCIDNLIKQNILKEFLEKNSSEVLNMITYEITQEEYDEILREEGREEGIEQGREQGKEELIKDTIIDNFNKGTSIELIADFLNISQGQVKQILQKEGKI
ncbi:MAG: Rpn family recombination-promoting nuclease/putative transposase [Acutalibacteraceae bacterium]|nr:Rpn family recombination-promoting nuclease/putative transposase [Acutalibacteraceae bacterium]